MKSESSKTLAQMLAILTMAGILSMVAHKSYSDISFLADRFSGAQFWRAVGQYFVGNLTGGKSVENIKP